MKNELISVIVPIFNSEKYIDRCLESLLNQTYKNIEIILVDDGSIDDSVLICKKYANKYKNVILIELENNKGVSYARNVGIKKSNGNYIVFVDSDDKISKNTIEILYKEIQNDNFDIVFSNYAIVYSDGKMTENKNDNSIKYKNFLDFISYNNHWGPVNKLIKKEQIKELFDENISIGEDVLFLNQNFKNCKYKYIDNITYYYYMNDNSTMNTKSVTSKNISFFKCFEKLINSNEGLSKDIFMAHYIDNLYKYNNLMVDKEKIFKNQKSYYNENARKYMRLLDKSSNISIIKKIKLHIKLILVSIC